MIEEPPSFQSNRDRDHLKLLEIFHYVMVGLALVGMIFLYLHYSLMSIAFSHPFPRQKDQMPFDPAEFFRVFRWIYLLIGLWGLASLAANLVSGLCIRARKYRFFSMLVSGFNCINMPLGTVLGVFTLIVLLRPTIPAVYHESP